MEKSDERHRQQCMNKTVHSCAIILYTCQETFSKVYSEYCCLSITKHTRTHGRTHACTHACMQARARERARAHTHTSHVSGIRHFQELSVNQGVNVQEFIWSIQFFFLFFFSVNVFYIVCVFLKHR